MRRTPPDVLRPALLRRGEEKEGGGVEGVEGNEQRFPLRDCSSMRRKKP